MRRCRILFPFGYIRTEPRLHPLLFLEILFRIAIDPIPIDYVAGLYSHPSLTVGFATVVDFAGVPSRFAPGGGIRHFLHAIGLL
jgi:hypothetical protein